MAPETVFGAEGEVAPRAVGGRGAGGADAGVVVAAETEADVGAGIEAVGEEERGGVERIGVHAGIAVVGVREVDFELAAARGNDGRIVGELGARDGGGQSEKKREGERGGKRKAGEWVHWAGAPRKAVTMVLALVSRRAR